jgi:2,3,4,5-tetrahydropyridine-2-carboxylate N-succinyltransferase
MILREIIDRLYELPPDRIDRDDALKVVAELKEYLNSGDVRAASPAGGSWTVHPWVKKGIILAFRVGRMRGLPQGETFRFFDKDTMDARPMSPDSGVRVVPGGTAVRNGSYLAPGVIIMPPSYVNIGAWVGAGTMVDSHVLVGSCAQVGARVHLSAGTQVGGVLEPVNSAPVLIEDDVFVGGTCGISIPEGAVVLAGSRKTGDEWAAEHRLSVYTPVIVKYRDERTDAATALESCLR